MDFFACSMIGLVTKMPDFTRKDSCTNQRSNSGGLFEGLTAEDDLLMEQILDNMNNTPIGKVLKTIASLPDDSRQKVLRVRKQLTEGRYDLDERLDVALEKVLDDLGA